MKIKKMIASWCPVEENRDLPAGLLIVDIEGNVFHSPYDGRKGHGEYLQTIDPVDLKNRELVLSLAGY